MDAITVKLAAAIGKIVNALEAVIALEMQAPVQAMIIIATGRIYKNSFRKKLLSIDRETKKNYFFSLTATVDQIVHETSRQMLLMNQPAKHRNETIMMKDHTIAHQEIVTVQTETDPIVRITVRDIKRSSFSFQSSFPAKHLILLIFNHHQVHHSNRMKCKIISTHPNMPDLIANEKKQI